MTLAILADEVDDGDHDHGADDDVDGVGDDGDYDDDGGGDVGDDAKDGSHDLGHSC